MATVIECLNSKILQQHLIYKTCAMAIISLIFPCHSTAAEWVFSPSLEVKETYSSNVRLASQGNEKGDYITQVNPGIYISGTGAHLKLYTNYLMQNVSYWGEKNKDATHHFLNSGINTELIDDYFFLDGKYSISQHSISPLSPFTFDNTNINIIDNRTQTTTYSVSPYFQHNFSNLFLSEVRYTHNAVETKANGFLNSHADNILFRLKSGSSFNDFGWELNYNKKNIDYTNTNYDSENEKYFLKLGYQLSPKFNLNATGGYERYDYISIKQTPEGKFWLAGFSWTPSIRTTVSANAGKRFWGDTYALTANHRTRRTVWSLGYNEEISDTRSQFMVPATIDTASFLDSLWASSIPDPVIRQQIIEVYMLENGIPASLANPVNFFTNRVFLQKRLQAAFALIGARSTVLFSMFNMLRESQTAEISDSALYGVNNIALSDKSKQTAANIIWTLKTSPVTSTNFGVGYIRYSFPDLDRQFDIQTISLNLIKKFQTNINGALGIRHVRRESTQEIEGYRENSITASMRLIF